MGERAEEIRRLQPTGRGDLPPSISPLPSGSADDRFDEIRQFIRTTMVAETIPSLAVAVAHRGEIVWEEAFGWADLEARVPATQHTPYSLASISKPIAATALMLLVEQGKVDLDRPVNDYLAAPGLTAHVGDASEATVRRVANHTSGLPLHYHFFPEDSPYRRPPMEETLRRYGHLTAAPGERFQYSNLGYGIIDHLVERLSGRGFGDFLRREIFLPLGMTRSSVDVEPELAPYAAARYRIDSRARLAFYDFDHPGGSAVYCSAHDLLRFGMFHLKTPLADQKAILPEASLDAMQAPTVWEREGTGYGIGWIVSDAVPGWRRISHSGGMPGVRTTLELLPSEGIAVVALANTSCNLPFQAAQRVFDLLAPEYGAAATPVRERQTADAERRPEPFRPPAELLGEWKGSVSTYAGDREVTLRFLESGEVHAKVGDGLMSLLNEVEFKKNRLFGHTYGELKTPDADRLPYHVHFDLTPRGDVLNGAAIAVSRPNTTYGNALAYWAELRRA